jgi:hypothetical protein
MKRLWRTVQFWSVLLFVAGLLCIVVRMIGAVRGGP